MSISSAIGYSSVAQSLVDSHSDTKTTANRANIGKIEKRSHNARSGSRGQSNVPFAANHTSKVRKG
jgi:hypothetical protein